MSDTVAMIVVVIAVVLVVALVAWLLMRTRGQERRAHEAEELRTEAAAHSGDVEMSKREVAARAASAEQAREQAEIAEARAAEAERELAQTEAHQEDKLRAADRIDPAVDHRSEDYRPGDVSPPRRPA